MRMTEGGKEGKGRGEREGDGEQGKARGENKNEEREVGLVGVPFECENMPPWPCFCVQGDGKVGVEREGEGEWRRTNRTQPLPPDTKMCSIWDAFLCLAGWVGVENLPNYQRIQRGMLMFWWEGLGGRELAKHTKRALVFSCL